MAARRVTHNGFHTHVLQDVALIVLSVLVAILLVKTNVLESLLAATGEQGFLGAIVAGMFFTSAFTTAPAIAALSHFALADGIVLTAFFGAVGAVIGDYVIFHVVRDRFSGHVDEIMAHKRIWKRFHILIKRRFFRYLTFLVGGAILASPLPDELGIAVLGFSAMKVKSFALLSFIFNFLGIVAIGLLARSLAA